MREAIFLGWVVWVLALFTCAALGIDAAALMLVAFGLVLFLASWAEVLDADKEKDLPL